MLSLYDSFKVPGVDAVTVYRDDEDAHAFYMVPTRPSIARDESGDPLFVFMLYARDLDRLGPTDAEIERGYLSLTTRVGVSKADEDAVRQYLRTRLNGELMRGYRYLLHPITRIEPTLGYPPVWTDGTVDFVTFDKEMVPTSAGSKEPGLVGENIATFSQQLTQDGAELFRQSIEKGIVPSIVLYKLHFLARIPAVTIHIYGNKRDFYEELKARTVVREYRTSNGNVVIRRVWSTSGTLQEFRNTFHSLKIDIDSGDFHDADPSDDVTEKLEELAFKVLETNILPSFFEQGVPAPTDDQTKDKWLVEQVTSGSIDVLIKRRDVVKQAVNPNSQLGLMLSPDEIKSNTTYVDLGDAAFKELDVKINANVNFATDPIFALKVFVDYNQQDELRSAAVAKAKEYLFRTGTEVHRFRSILARAADRTPKDTYRFHSELVYKDTGETVRIPATGETESRERELVISYRRLGFVKVALTMGAMPDNVKSAEVSIRYPGSTLPSAHQKIVLTPQKPAGTFFTYTGGTGDPRPYRYSVTYVLAGDQRMETPEQEDVADSLTITSPFEQTVVTRFVAQADFSVVQKIVIDAHYEDARNNFNADRHAELTQGADSDSWSVPLRDPDLRAFKYDEMTFFKSGAKDVKSGKTARLGGTVVVGPGGIDALDVTVDAGLLDWGKYARALVYLTYGDPANGVSEQKQMRFDAQNSQQVQTWHVLLHDKTKRKYKVRVRLVGKNPADDREIPETEPNDEFVLIR